MSELRSLADIIIALDKQQNREGARVCAVDASHGRLTALPDGRHIACGLCGYAEVAVPYVEEKAPRRAAPKAKRK